MTGVMERHRWMVNSTTCYDSAAASAMIVVGVGGNRDIQPVLFAVRLIADEYFTSHHFRLLASKYRIANMNPQSY